MPRVTLAVLIGLAAGLALAPWLTGDRDVGPAAGVHNVESLQPLAERLLSLEQLIAEERDARLNLGRQLQRFIEEGSAQATARSPAAAIDADDAVDGRQPQRRSRDWVALMQDFEERRLGNLVANGFSEDEARRVLQRESEAEFRIRLGQKAREENDALAARIAALAAWSPR